MYIPQDSRNNAVDINSVLSPSAGFALDSSLDAELSLHNVASDSWNNPNADVIFANGNSYVYPPHQQSGSPTSTTVATPTNDFNASITTGSVSQPAISSQPGIFAPTVVLRRPSADTSGIKLEGLPERTLTPSPFDYQSTPSPLRDFGNLDLKSALTIDGPVCLMNGDTVEYVDHLLPVSPGGSSCGGASGLSAPNSPMFDLSPDNLDNINTNKNATNDYLQMSNWENSISLSPTSSPPPMGLDLPGQQKGQDWLPGANQYQQHQQNLTSFPEPFTSGTSTPMAPFGGDADPTQQEQRQQPPTQRRSAHNAVEKKYRNNINDRIAELKNAVPALRHARVKKDASASHDDNNNEDEDSDEPVFMDGVAVATKLNKATILQKATEYVFHLQHANTELKQDIDALLTTIANNIPNGHELAQQYRQHVHQRDTLQQQQLLYREKMKRHKKSGPVHYQYQHQQQQHHHHSPVKGENRSSNQQHPQFLYLQQQQ